MADSPMASTPHEKTNRTTSTMKNWFAPNLWELSMVFPMRLKMGLTTNSRTRKLPAEGISDRQAHRPRGSCRER